MGVGAVSALISGTGSPMAHLRFHLVETQSVQDMLWRREG
jgi:hypothetical protein